MAALAALGATYVAATTVNDIADQDVDRINHPHSPGRPLVAGQATERDLYIVHAIAVAVVIACGLWLGWTALAILAVSLAINYVYSVKPVQLSYRTFLAPLLLAVAYVAVPFALGITIADGKFTQSTTLFLTSLVLLFLGRILLKDFRDRAGDSMYHKPTFLLKYGKTATCIVSAGAIVLGNGLLLVSLTPIGPAVVILQLFFLAIYNMSYRLWRAQTHEDEQRAIGIGAKMGNGLLVTGLGIIILVSYGASANAIVFLTALFTLLFMINYIVFLKNPRYAVIGYRG